MLRIAIAGAVLAAAVGMPALAAAADADDVLGVWMTEEKDAHARIYKKETDDGKTVYAGKIIWIDEPVYPEGDPEAGEPKHDRENPDEALRDRPIVGLEFLKGFTFNSGEGIWDGGTIYDPNNGKTYKSKMELEAREGVPGGEVLKIRGYVGVPLLGRTTVWTHVPEEERKNYKEQTG